MIGLCGGFNASLTNSFASADIETPFLGLLSSHAFRILEICGVLFWCRLTLIAYTSIWSSCDGLDTYLNRSSRYLFSALLVWEPFFLFFNCSWSIGFIWINSITSLFTNCLSTCISIVLLGLLLHFRSLCPNPHLRCPPFLVAHQISSTPGLRLSCSLIDFRSCITSPPFHLLLTLDLCPSILSSPGVSPVSLFPTLLCYRPALGNSSKIYCRTSWLLHELFGSENFITYAILLGL